MQNQRATEASSVREITDAGLLRLHGLTKLKHLYLNFLGTDSEQLSAKGRQQLQRAIPGLKIVRE